jgi:hypothetical protein
MRWTQTVKEAETLKLAENIVFRNYCANLQSTRAIDDPTEPCYQVTLDCLTSIEYEHLKVLPQGSASLELYSLRNRNSNLPVHFSDIVPRLHVQENRSYISLYAVDYHCACVTTGV